MQLEAVAQAIFGPYDQGSLPGNGETARWATPFLRRRKPDSDPLVYQTYRAQNKHGCIRHFDRHSRQIRVVETILYNQLTFVCLHGVYTEVTGVWMEKKTHKHVIFMMPSSFPFCIADTRSLSHCSPHVPRTVGTFRKHL